MSITEVDIDHPYLDYDNSIFPHLRHLDEPTLTQLYEKIEHIRNIRWALQGVSGLASSLALVSAFSINLLTAGSLAAVAAVAFVASIYFQKPPPYLILSIDGGGIRGMIPITILAHIEEELGAPIGQIFDCIAGTSIGGILALALSQPHPENPNLPKMTACEVAQFLKEKGPIVFERTTMQAIQSVDGVRTPKYTNNNLKQILVEQFGDTKLNEAVTDVLTPSFDLNQGRPAVFFHVKGEETKKPLLMRDVGLATAAAPIYFPSHTVDELNLVDGGLVANNPALLAYMKAAGHIDPNRDIFILSIGTGLMPKKPIPPAESENYGMIQWLPLIFDLIFQSNQDVLTLQFKLIKYVGNAPITLVRLQPTLHKASQEQLDNATPRNIEALQKIATQYFNQNVAWLQRDIIQPLKKYRTA